MLEYHMTACRFAHLDSETGGDRFQRSMRQSRGFRRICSRSLSNLLMAGMILNIVLSCQPLAGI